MTVAVLCKVVSPTGFRSIGWRPSSIATHPVEWVFNNPLVPIPDRHYTGQPFTPVKFHQSTWG